MARPSIALQLTGGGLVVARLRARRHPIDRRTLLIPFLLALALSAFPSVAAGGEAARARAAIAAQAVEVGCQPTLPYFCSNIHVACSGRTQTRTFAFRLRAQPGRGWIESASDTSGIRKLYENGRVDWGARAAYVLLRPRGADGYIKLLADGSYSFRYYARDAALMSQGRCR